MVENTRPTSYFRENVVSKLILIIMEISTPTQQLHYMQVTGLYIFIKSHRKNTETSRLQNADTVAANE